MLSSQLVRAVLDSAPDAMIVIDAAGAVIYSNSQVQRLFGYTELEIAGQPVEILLPERLRGQHVQHRRQFAQSARVRPMGAGLDLLGRRKDGSEFPVEISLSPVGDSGRPLVAAAIRDVTERVRAQEEFRAVQSLADAANRAKSRFLATASHDLRQPVQALALLNAALRRNPSEEDRTQILDLQERSTAAMTRLLNALLDISRLESGAIRAEARDFRLAELLGDLGLEFRELAANKGLGLDIEATDANIQSDPELVRQALKNLLSNAIKYTNHGRVRVNVQARDSAVRIEVQDSGIGIPQDQLGHIFEEFFRVDGPANAQRDGYGLGLSIVQRVMALLGTQLEVQSEPGRGSSFAFELPRSAGRAAATVPGARSPLPDRVPATGERILLVEDDAGVRQATRVFLASAGYPVTAAASYDEALHCIERDPEISIVVSDYRLDGAHTGMDVIAVAREKLGPRVKAIVVTGDTSSAIRDMKADPSLHVVSKPIDSDRLLGIMRGLSADPATAPSPRSAAPLTT
jgi:PAS domain S-box-containing protein